jgi:RimJ/RimL family protein N-acetyltransferase
VTVLPPTLVSERLRCERFGAAHVTELALLDTDPRVQATIFGHTYTLAETRERARRRVAMWIDYGYGDYVARLVDGEFIGCGGIFPSDLPDAIAVGYALRPSYWGFGYATELCAALTVAALSLQRADVVAIVLEGNTASRRVLEKNGYTLIGPNADDAGTVLYRYG